MDTYIRELEHRRIMHDINDAQTTIQNMLGELKALDSHKMDVPVWSSTEIDSDFRWSLTFAECDNLKIGDFIDHRDNGGLFTLAKIIDKKEHELNIHYEGWDKKWDTWCDYKSETYRFAAPKSISNKQNTLMKNLQIGDTVRINRMRTGWKTGKIVKSHKHSGQVCVMYQENNKKRGYWVHLNNTSEITTCWMSESDVSSKMEFENLFMLDETNIITVPPKWHWSTKSEGLYRYNILGNEWSLHQKFPDGFYFGANTKIDNVAFDSKNNHVYINKNDKKHDSGSMKWTDLEVTIFYVKNCQKSIVINGEYHTFCLTENKLGYDAFTGEHNYDADLQHLCWNGENNKFDKIHTFENLPLGKFGLIYAPKQRRLLLIGGDEVLKEHGTSSDIYSFSLKNKTWQKCKTKLPISLYGFGYALTNDHNNVIILGGSTTIGEHIFDKTDIYVLNLETMCIKKSFMTCPKKSSSYGTMQAVITGNLPKVEMLITGFLRLAVDTNYVPNDIRKIMKAYLNAASNYIHLFDRCNHWKIRINDIMNSL